ncbi:MAG: hypothetical protein M3Z04_17080 [Chloroflexota bacterium]|nr:hypothetical protein [Chloroflexota bacterium]
MKSEVDWAGLAACLIPADAVLVEPEATERGRLELAATATKPAYAGWSRRNYSLSDNDLEKRFVAPLRSQHPQVRTPWAARRSHLGCKLLVLHF